MRKNNNLTLSEQVNYDMLIFLINHYVRNEYNRENIIYYVDLVITSILKGRNNNGNS